MTDELLKSAYEGLVATWRALNKGHRSQLLVGIEAPLPVFPKSHTRHSPFTLGLFHLPDSSTKYYGR